MLKIYASPFMNWFKNIIDNENKEFKLIALKEYKEMIYNSSGKKCFFVNSKEVVLTDEQLINYEF